MLLQPRSKVVSETFVSELESIQERPLELEPEVVIFGGVPEGRVAAFLLPLENSDYFMHYLIPYPE
jgi:hypothetical protein